MQLTGGAAIDPSACACAIVLDCCGHKQQQQLAAAAAAAAAEAQHAIPTITAAYTTGERIVSLKINLTSDFNA